MHQWLLLVNAIVVLLLGIAPARAATPANQPADTTIPLFSEVRDVVLQHFQAKPDFQSGDLITRDDVAPLLAQFQRTWLPAADAAQILERVPVRGEFLVNELSTPNGRRFMRRIANYPNAYDRVDRLSRMPHGRDTVSALVRGPGGEKMIEYMTMSSGGRVLGRQLSNAPDGRNFNAPTGRIYTVAMLLSQLQRSYTAVTSPAEVKGAVATEPAEQLRPTNRGPGNTSQGY